MLSFMFRALIILLTFGSFKDMQRTISLFVSIDVS
ncbi:hypothetical protein GLYMA_11G218150v4 [Glycine max]|nr:hypothetical protein GLYMA_11G218150v4 [Glycine max]KAH1160243.1 hypothetical protein GYH30_031833 [Glycine max]